MLFLRRLGFDAEIQEVPVMTHLPAGPPTLSAVEGGAVVYEDSSEGCSAMTSTRSKFMIERQNHRFARARDIPGSANCLRPHSE